MVFGIFLLIFFPFLSSFSVYRGGGGGVQDHLSSPWPTYTTVHCFAKGTSLTIQSIYLDIHLDKQNNLKAMQYMI